MFKENFPSYMHTPFQTIEWLTVYMWGEEKVQNGVYMNTYTYIWLQHWKIGFLISCRKLYTCNIVQVNCSPLSSTQIQKKSQYIYWIQIYPITYPIILQQIKHPLTVFKCLLQYISLKGVGFMYLQMFNYYRCVPYITSG